MYTIFIDTPLSVIRFQQRPVELPGLALVETGVAQVDGGLRRYYAAHPPLRLLLVMKTGREATELRIGSYVSALVGWDEGDNPYVLSGQENKRHTKITVSTIFDGPLPEGASVTPLSEIIARAPRADRPGGWRGGNSGRPRLVNDDQTESHTVSLPSKLWRAIELEGGGNRSAGVRRAAVLADLWEER